MTVYRYKGGALHDPKSYDPEGLPTNDDDVKVEKIGNYCTECGKHVNFHMPDCTRGLFERLVKRGYCVTAVNRDLFAKKCDVTVTVYGKTFDDLLAMLPGRREKPAGSPSQTAALDPLCKVFTPIIDACEFLVEAVKVCLAAANEDARDSYARQAREELKRAHAALTKTLVNASGQRGSLQNTAAQLGTIMGGAELKPITTIVWQDGRATVPIGTECRCLCSAADKCPLGRVGTTLRCTAFELVNAGHSVRKP